MTPPVVRWYVRITYATPDGEPSKRIYPERVVDLSYRDFGVVCGDPSPGVCDVTVERLR